MNGYELHRAAYQKLLADETDPEPMRGTPEWYAWADRHDEEDGDG